MNTYKYEHPTHEPDEVEREKMTFNKPFQDPVIEGAPNSYELDLGAVVILSSN